MFTIGILAGESCMINRRIEMKLFLILLFVFLSGCATTNKKPIITLTDYQGKKLNKYLSKGIKHYKDGEFVRAEKEFQKFFNTLNINAIIEFEEIIDKESYKKQVVKEYIDRLEPKLLDRERNVQALFTQGAALYEKRQYKNSIEYFVKVLVLDSRHQDAMKYINLANVEINRIEEENEKIRLIEEERVRKAQVNLYYKNGVDYYHDNNLEKAIVEFKKVLEINPKDKRVKEYYNDIRAKLYDKAKVYYKEGLMLYSAGDIEKAIDKWTRALELAPDYREAQKALERAKVKINK